MTQQQYKQQYKTTNNVWFPKKISKIFFSWTSKSSMWVRKFFFAVYVGLRVWYAFLKHSGQMNGWKFKPKTVSKSDTDGLCKMGTIPVKNPFSNICAKTVQQSKKKLHICRHIRRHNEECINLLVNCLR